MGATLSDKGNPYFECGSTAEADERWQVVTPHRVLPGGVQGLNRMSHMEFRVGTIDFARACNRRQPFKAYRITPPRGPEQIVFGDKVICLRNGDLRLAGQEKQYGYVANGEVGIIIGESFVSNSKPKHLDVEFSTQPGVSYKLCKSEFDEDISMMELAYAITAHKSQGSQSRTVILIYRSARPSCPAKCFTRRQRGSSNALSFCTTAIFPTSLRSAAIGTPKS